jgi:hypothetical protein
LQALQHAAERSPARALHWLFKELPKDPWGGDYIYRNPGRKTQVATTCFLQVQTDNLTPLTTIGVISCYNVFAGPSE